MRLVKHIMSKVDNLRAFTYDTALRVVHRAPLIAAGLVVYTPLPVQELECRKGTRIRFYQRIQIPCPQGNQHTRIRVDETNEDREVDPSTKRRRFNRTEHLRQIAPGAPAGKRLNGFRQDSESQPSRFDQAHHLERVPAYGAVGALLIHLGYAWVNRSPAPSAATGPEPAHQVAAGPQGPAATTPRWSPPYPGADAPPGKPASCTDRPATLSSGGAGFAGDTSTTLSGPN